MQELPPHKMSVNKVEIIQKWIETEAPFYGRTDEKFILNFLDVCDDDIDRAKQRMTTYYQYRQDYPQIMTNLDILDPKILKLVQQNVPIMDRREDLNYPNVFAGIASKYERDDTLWDGFRMAMMVAESTLLHSLRLRKYGFIFIMDLDRVKLCHALQCTPTFLIHTLKCFMEGIPIKFHQFHIINTGYIVKAAINAAIAFLPSEINKKVHIHVGSWECMKEYTSFEGLPIEYGGTDGTIEENSKSLMDALLQYRDYLVDDAKYGFRN